jgi:hypothetical protein
MDKNSYRLIEGTVLLAAFIVTFVCFYQIIYAVPQRAEEIRGRSIKVQCASIHPGMSFGEVVEAFDREGIPREQSFTDQRAVFGTAAGSCYVEFGNNGLVSKAELRRPVWEY